MFITWRLASKLFRGVLVICEAWNIGSCKLLSLKLRVLLFVKLKLTFMFYLLWWYSRTCTCRVSRVKTRPPSLSMPTDLKTSSDFASSFVLKAPLEIDSSFCVWNKYIFYMTDCHMFLVCWPKLTHTWMLPTKTRASTENLRVVRWKYDKHQNQLESESYMVTHITHSISHLYQTCLNWRHFGYL